MAVGFVVGMITLRTRGPTFIISTIALVLLTKIALDNWDYIGGANGMSLPLVPLPVEVVKLPFYYGMLLVAIGAVYLSFRIRRSKFGLGLRAISQDEIRAEVAGIPTGFYKILAFAVSGLFVGMAGALWGYYLTFLRPTIFLSILIGAKIVLMTILGGRGTVAGPVVGAILFIAVNEFFVSRFGTSELNIAATGLLADPGAAVLPRRHHRHAQAQGPAAACARLGLSFSAGPGTVPSRSTNASGSWMCGQWPRPGKTVTSAAASRSARARPSTGGVAWSSAPTTIRVGLRMPATSSLRSSAASARQAAAKTAGSNRV